MPEVLRFYCGKDNDVVLVVRDRATRTAIPLSPYGEVRLVVEGLGTYSTVSTPDIVSIISVSDGGGTADALSVRLGDQVSSCSQVLRFPAYVEAISGADIIRLLDSTDILVEFTP